jgi:hypothetical protein
MHPDARGGDSRTGWGFELVWVVERRGKFKRVGRFRRWRCFGGVKREAKPISSVTETLGSRGRRSRQDNFGCACLGRGRKAREGKSGEGPVVPGREKTLEDEKAQKSHALGSV